MEQRYKICQNTRSYIVSILGSSLLVATHSTAADYYWDTNSDTAGFGSASGTTWSSVAANNFWSTSPTEEALVTDYATLTTDDLYFGTESLPLSGSVTIDGTVNANSIFNAAGNFSGTNPTINFSAEGSYTRANNNGSFPSGTTEVSALEQLGPAGSTIQVGSGTADLSSGSLRITGTALSNFDNRNFQTTDGKSLTLEIIETAHTFTLDRVLNMGTGALIKNGDGTLVLTEANTEKTGYCYLAVKNQTNHRAPVGYFPTGTLFW